MFGRDNQLKNTSNSLLERQKIGITSIWEDLEDKLLTPGELLGYFWLPWGITVYSKYIYCIRNASSFSQLLRSYL